MADDARAKLLEVGTHGFLSVRQESARSHDLGRVGVGLVLVERDVRIERAFADSYRRDAAVRRALG